MLIRLNLGLYYWVCALNHCSFGGSLVRVLDYIWDAQTAQVRASTTHFWFFFQKFALLFIIWIYLDSKEKILKVHISFII